MLFETQPETVNRLTTFGSVVDGYQFMISDAIVWNLSETTAYLQVPADRQVEQVPFDNPHWNRDVVHCFNQKVAWLTTDGQDVKATYQREPITITWEDCKDRPPHQSVDGWKWLQAAVPHGKIRIAAWCIKWQANDQWIEMHVGASGIAEDCRAYIQACDTAGDEPERAAMERSYYPACIWVPDDASAGAVKPSHHIFAENFTGRESGVYRWQRQILTS